MILYIAICITSFLPRSFRDIRYFPAWRADGSRPSETRRRSGLVLTRLPKPCDKLRSRAEERLVSAGTKTVQESCARRALLVSGRRPHRVKSKVTGQAEDETAPAGQHRTADRLAEKAGERRVFAPLVPAVRL